MSDDMVERVARAITIRGLSPSEYVRGIKNGNIDPTYYRAIDAILWAADEIERLTAEAKSYRDAIEWMRARDDRNGSLPEAYREKIDEALGGLMP